MTGSTKRSDRDAPVRDAQPLVPRAVAALNREADQDGIPRWLAWTTFWTPAVGAVLLVALFFVSRDAYFWILYEDRPIEWLQFTLCLTTGALAFAAARRFAARRELAVTGALVLFGLGALFLAGEEISWAQRVFAFGTPEHLASLNSQEEVTLHNIDSMAIDIQDLFKVFAFLLGLGGVVLAVLGRGERPWLSGRFWQLVTPPRYAIPGFLSMVLYRPFRLLDIAYGPVLRFQEWAEAGLMIALAITACVIYLRSMRSEPPAPSGPGFADGSVRTQALRLPRTVVVVVAVAVLVTVVFAALTAYHGIPPGNPEI